MTSTTVFVPYLQRRMRHDAPSGRREARKEGGMMFQVEQVRLFYQSFFWQKSSLKLR